MKIMDGNLILRFEMTKYYQIHVKKSLSFDGVQKLKWKCYFKPMVYEAEKHNIKNLDYIIK